MTRTRSFLVAIFLVGALMPFSSAQDAKPNKEKLSALLQKLKSADPDARLAAVIELADHGSHAAPAIPMLIALFRDKDEDFRLNAALTLGKIGPAAVPSLIKVLESKDDATSYYALFALAWIGPPAKDAAQTIVKTLTDSREEIRRKAVYAVGRIMPDDAVADGVAKVCRSRLGGRPFGQKCNVSPTHSVGSAKR